MTFCVAHSSHFVVSCPACCKNAVCIHGNTAGLFVALGQHTLLCSCPVESSCWCGFKSPLQTYFDEGTLRLTVRVSDFACNIKVVFVDLIKQAPATVGKLLGNIKCMMMILNLSFFFFINMHALISCLLANLCRIVSIK